MPHEDVKAIVKELLVRFRGGQTLDDATVEHFAEMGARALAAAQDGNDPWLSPGEAAERLKLTSEEVRGLVRQQALPAVTDQANELRFHRRDVSIFWLGRVLALGGTEQQITPLTPPVAWSEADHWGLNPYKELTPG